MNLSNTEIIEAVRESIDERNKVIKLLYEDEVLRDSIVSYIKSKGGTEQDGNDARTFGIVTFIQQCYRPHFTLSKDVNSYIFSIAKYEFFRAAKKQNKFVSEDKRPELSDDINVETEIIQQERYHALKKAMNALDEKCREVLSMWANNYKMREIALKMIYKSEGMARKKKHECMKKIRQLMKNI